MDPHPREAGGGFHSWDFIHQPGRVELAPANAWILGVNRSAAHARRATSKENEWSASP
jgi:hypothetical protein